MEHVRVQDIPVIEATSNTNPDPEHEIYDAEGRLIATWDEWPRKPEAHDPAS